MSNFDHAIHVLRRALREDEEEAGFARASLDLMAGCFSSGNHLYVTQVTRLETANYRIRELNAAIECLVNAEAGIPIMVDEHYDQLEPHDAWRNTEKFRKENEGP